MSVSSEDLIALAETLSTHESECALRAAIGRGYYAIYHRARLAAEAMGLEKYPASGSKGSHERVIYRFESGSKGLRTLARTIRKLKMVRAAADYEIEEDLKLPTVQLHLANCRRVLSQLESLCEPRARSEG